MVWPLILPFGESAMMFCGLSDSDRSQSMVKTRAVTAPALCFGVQSLAVGEADPDCRDVLRVAKRAGQQLRTTRLALIEDDHCFVTSALALATLSSKVQVPRWISAMEGRWRGREVRRFAT